MTTPVSRVSAPSNIDAPRGRRLHSGPRGLLTIPGGKSPGGNLGKESLQLDALTSRLSLSSLIIKDLPVPFPPHADTIFASDSLHTTASAAPST